MLAHWQIVPEHSKKRRFRWWTISERSDFLTSCAASPTSPVCLGHHELSVWNIQMRPSSPQSAPRSSRLHFPWPRLPWWLSRSAFESWLKRKQMGELWTQKWRKLVDGDSWPLQRINRQKWKCARLQCRVGAQFSTQFGLWFRFLLVRHGRAGFELLLGSNPFFCWWLLGEFFHFQGFISAKLGMHGGDTESAVTRSPHIWASTMVITCLIAYRSHILFPVIHCGKYSPWQSVHFTILHQRDIQCLPAQGTMIF